MVMEEVCAQLRSGIGIGGYSSGSEEEPTILPRHTKVVVTGNNRTKSVLVGLQGVVKKAVGLGGWHWLVLANGIEVKLQRNALSVIETPTGKEEEEVDNASDLDRSHRSSHKPRGSSSHTLHAHGSQKVDLGKLEMRALRRYWEHFNLVDASPNPSKEQLLDVVQRHFVSQLKMDELQVIVGFVQAAKKLKGLYKS